MELAKTLIGHTKSLKVYVVDGDAVRKSLDMDYTQGGHDRVYKYIPEGEVWIDDDFEQHEWGFIILHELTERFLMGRGLTYEQAHPVANQVELFYRRQPKKLEAALREEGFEWEAKGE